MNLGWTELSWVDDFGGDGNKLRKVPKYKYFLGLKCTYYFFFFHKTRGPAPLGPLHLRLYAYMNMHERERERERERSNWKQNNEEE